ncbi:hypothetical protein Hanom_Chr02g00111091 [Helianthus anomalus]
MFRVLTKDPFLRRRMEPLLVKATRILRLPAWIPVRSTSADQGLHVPGFSGSELISGDCDVEEVRVRAVIGRW